MTVVRLVSAAMLGNLPIPEISPKRNWGPGSMRVTVLYLASETIGDQDRIFTTSAYRYLGMEDYRQYLRPNRPGNVKLAEV